jgi:hypothetical protein
MKSNSKIRFTLSDEDKEFIEAYQHEKGLRYFSDALSVLISDHKKLNQQLERTQSASQQCLELSRSAARDAHLCLCLTQKISVGFTLNKRRR